MSHNKSSSSSFDIFFYYTSAYLLYSLTTNTPIAEKMTVDIKNVNHTDQRQTIPQMIAVAEEEEEEGRGGIATVSTTDTITITTTITTAK